MVNEACRKLSVEFTEYRFTRREVRRFTGWGDTQLKVHLKRLEELEYLVVYRRGPKEPFVYELLYHGEGKGGDCFLPCLLKSEELAQLQSA